MIGRTRPLDAPPTRPCAPTGVMIVRSTRSRSGDHTGELVAALSAVAANVDRIPRHRQRQAILLLDRLTDLMECTSE